MFCPAPFKKDIACKEQKLTLRTCKCGAVFAFNKLSVLIKTCLKQKEKTK